VCALDVPFPTAIGGTRRSRGVSRSIRDSSRRGLGHARARAAISRVGARARRRIPFDASVSSSRDGASGVRVDDDRRARASVGVGDGDEGTRARASTSSSTWISRRRGN
jgi:hypothetical protein